MSNREPKWSTWDLLPKVELWEAVALSFNIDPHQIKRNPHQWLVGHQPIFNEGKDFDDRLRIIKANIGNHELLKGRQDCTLRSINLVIFAKWATTIGWEIPPKLESIGHKYVDDVVNVETLPQVAYTTDLLDILNLAVIEFFNPRHDVDAKAENIYEWLEIKGKEKKIDISENIAHAMFTIIKPHNHNPKKRRVEPLD